MMAAYRAWLGLAELIYTRDHLPFSSHLDEISMTVGCLHGSNSLATLLHESIFSRISAHGDDSGNACKKSIAWIHEDQIRSDYYHI